MRPPTTFAASAAGAVILVAFGLTACSSATTTPTPPRQAAPALIDCGTHPAEPLYEKVMVVNRTSKVVRVSTRGVDCWDWGGTYNPSRLDGIELSPGASSADELFVVRSIPQANLLIRPWDMGIYYLEGAEWLVTWVEPRPTFGAAPDKCNTSKGLTACIGMSLCPGPDYLERRVDAPLVQADSTDAGRRIVITTYCSLADNSARIVVTDG